MSDSSGVNDCMVVAVVVLPVSPKVCLVGLETRLGSCLEMHSRREGLIMRLQAVSVLPNCGFDLCNLRD